MSNTRRLIAYHEAGHVPVTIASARPLTGGFPMSSRVPAIPPTPAIREAEKNAEWVYTIDSKGVDKFGYDTLTDTVFVTWITGKTYAYTGFEQHEWDEFMATSSKGKFANFGVKYKHLTCYGPL